MQVVSSMSRQLFLQELRRLTTPGRLCSRTSSSRFSNEAMNTRLPRAARSFSTAPSRSVDAYEEPDKQESFLSGQAAVYAEQMYEQYLQNPESVDASWRRYFDNDQAGKTFDVADYDKPTAVPNVRTNLAAASSSTSESEVAPSDSLALAHLIRAYQVNGHLAAKLDPLNMFTSEAFPHRPWRPSKGHEFPKELTLEYHGFSQGELDRKLNFKGTNSGGNKGYLEELGNMAQSSKITLRMILAELQKTYCGTLGVEYMHISDIDKQNWIRERVEHPRWVRYDREKKQHIFERLCFADTFETFLAQKFNTTKRFGLDGGEAIVPALKDAIDRASELGAHSFVLGMPHRGRLNVLANVMRKPMPLIFSEFQGTAQNIEQHSKLGEDKWGMSGDVKYHLGSSMDRTYPDGRRIHLSLVANPSHLECVNPLVVGKARAKQYYAGNKIKDMQNVVPILLHGDAAFAGQGVVYETMQMAGIDDFDVGGTIHVVVNNQIGYTTNPNHSRSTPYCSDLGKAFDCPVFHCNGDDPLAVSTALETAVEFRHEWGSDVIIDMICYRRNGHNEMDQPAFTQPMLYKEIRKHPTTLQIFEKRLVEDGTLTKEEVEEIKQFTLDSYEKDLKESKTYVKKESDWLASRWEGFKGPSQLSRIRETGVDIELLRKIGITAGTVPENFKLHRQMVKIFKSRKEKAEKGEGIDWGTAEAMAIGSLLLEGNHVRITGQDVQRGTFSHRHAVVKDQDTEAEYTPLNHLVESMDPTAPLTVDGHTNAEERQAGFTCRNSILSEFGVLGYELGYSLENPNALVMWEAQFGDFANGAQVMFDQFISSGEDKWMRQSGLVCLLPHGYDGGGAEHSSCRLERFLQQVDEDPHYIPSMTRDERMQIQRSNWQVVNCSTPANFFHCLRRQIHRDFRKPLIVASPKNMLRNKACVSTLEEMGPGTEFKRLIPETDPEISQNPDQVKTLVFCSGQIYYQLLEERTARNRKDVALVRLEQIAPFAFDRIARNAAHYENAEIVFAQEEPKNMGAYSYVLPRIMTATREINGNEKRPRYVGRPVSAAPATGVSKVHQMEKQAILKGVFGED